MQNSSLSNCSFAKSVHSLYNHKMVGKTNHLSFDTKKDAMGKKVLHVLKAEGDIAVYLLALFAK